MIVDPAQPGFPVRIERLNDFRGDVGFGAVVAIPVKNEAERIGLCLQALAAQEGVDFADLAIVLLLNNCRDDTALRIRELAPDLPFALEVRHAELGPDYANAGWARRLAMDAAADALRPDGVILTTDADSFVDASWVRVNLSELGRGVDAVAGFITAEPMELMELPPEILERGALEWEYQHLAAELEARADPEPHDAWPRHNQNCGASAALTLAAYRRIGGLPTRAVGEDRALFEALRRADLKIRHSLDAHVVTSARTDGRASGGLADAIRLRTDPDHPCDELLEVAIMTLRRSLWRNTLRETWRSSRVEAQADAWAHRLRIAVTDVRRAARAPTFGEFWSELEAASPRLTRRLVTGAGLQREVRRIKRLVHAARVRAKAAAAASRNARQIAAA